MVNPLAAAPTAFRHRFAFAMVLGSALAVSGIVDVRSTGTIMAQAADPCALLTTDEIQPLAGKEQIAPGVASAIQSLGRVACRYQWGVGTGRYILDVIVNEASRMNSNMTADAIKQKLATPGGAGTVNEVVPDVGEAAAFKSDSHLLATAAAYTKGRVLQLTLDGYDARLKKDQVIALLRAGTSRL